MKSKIAAVIFNSGLLVLVVTLLSAPLLLGQLLGEFESGALGVATTGSPANDSSALTTTSGIAVYPNVTDFTEYAAFADDPMVSENTYQTSVTFTAFAGQQAAYNSLFTVYNTSSSTLSVSVEGGKLSTPLPGSQVWLNIVPDGGAPSTLVTEAVEVGSEIVRLAQVSGFAQGNAVVDGQVLEVTKVTPTSISLASPLKSALAVGERVYLGPVYYNQSVTPSPSTSHTIQLQPQQKAIINLAAATTADQAATSQSVLPIIIRTK